MKSNHITRIITAILFAVTLFTGCQNDQEDALTPSPKVKDGVYSVVLRFDSPGSEMLTTKSVSSNNQSRVSRIAVLVFRNNGRGTARENTFLYSQNVTIAPNASSFEISLRDEGTTKCKLVFIANATAQLNGIISGLSTSSTEEDVMNSLKFDYTNRFIADNNNSIPMWAQSLPIEINSSMNVDAMYPNHRSIAFLRVLAKVNVVNENSDFNLQKVIVYHYNTGGMVIPDTRNLSADGWSGVTAPTIPQNVQTIFSEEYNVANNRLLDEIFVPEFRQGSNVQVNMFMIVYGSYKGGNPTYYRVDFKDGGNNMLNILRNHSYNVTLTKVSGNGYTSEEAALNSREVSNIRYVVTDWNNVEIGINDSINEILLSTSMIEAPSTGATHNIPLFTNLAQNWSVRSTESWIRTSKYNGSFTVEVLPAGSNVSGSRRTGTVFITVGNITIPIQVIQKLSGTNGWAGSNIYWDGNKLTFDDTDSDPSYPVAVHRYYQGVYFMWGSLVAIASTSRNVPLGYFSYGAPNAPLLHIPNPNSATNGGWNPYNGSTVGFGYIPRMGWMNSSNPNNGSGFVSLPDDNNANYCYTHHDPAHNVGDICRYLTEKGWAPGAREGKKWRMPTAREYEMLSQSGVYTTGNFYINPDRPWGDGLVYTKLAYDYFNGKRIGLVLPFNGGCNWKNNEPLNVGEKVFLWSGSAASADRARAFVRFSDGHVNITNQFERTVGGGVRCIEE